MAKDEAKLLIKERRENKVLELTPEEASLYPAFNEDISFFSVSNSSFKVEIDKNEPEVIEIKEEDDADASQTSKINDDISEIKDETIEIINTSKIIYFLWVFNKIFEVNSGAYLKIQGRVILQKVVNGEFEN